MLLAEGIERTSFCHWNRTQDDPLSVFDRIERAGLYFSFILALNYTNTSCSLCQQSRPSLSEGPTILEYFCPFSIWRREQTKHSKRHCKINPRSWTMLNTPDKLIVVYLGQKFVHLSHYCSSCIHLAPLGALPPWLFVALYLGGMRLKHELHHLDPVSACFRNEWNSTSIHLHGVVLK
jgi:hypothetical protein